MIKEREKIMEHKVVPALARLEQLLQCYPELECCRDEIIMSFNILQEAYRNGRKLLIAGNGGSAADSAHIAGELMKSFHFRRKPEPVLCRNLELCYGAAGQTAADFLEGALPAVALPEMMALSTAYMNDADPEGVFAQGVYGLGQQGDVLLAISTSGNSKNILYACMTANVKGMKTIGLTGKSGGKMLGLCDCVICVPFTDTYRIQERHLPIYHALCAMLEAEFFDVGERV